MKRQEEKVNYSSRERERWYMDQVLKEFEKNGISYDETPYGIRFAIEFDKWIIASAGVRNGKITISLYHKNLFRGCRFTRNHGRFLTGVSGVPDYHLQFRREISPAGLVGYCIRHSEKYGMKNNSIMPA